MSETAIVLVFVNYRDYSALERLLAVQSRSYENCRIVVVDNTEPEDRDHLALDRIRSFAHTTVFLTENLGYLGAVRYAIEHEPDIECAAFLLVCNTDLKFSFADFSEYLSRVREDFEDQRVGVVAPRLVRENGHRAKQLHLTRKPSAQRMKQLAIFFSNYSFLVLYKLASDIKRRLVSLKELDTSTLRDGQRIFAPHGALMILTKDFLSIKDALSFPGFIYGEEIFIGLRAEEAGLSCIYSESITYAHQSHGSMGSWPSRSIARYLRDAHEWASGALAASESRSSEAQGRKES